MHGHGKLEAAIAAPTRCKLHKRKRIQWEGTLVVTAGVRLAILRESNAY